jgi:hypothetical protein
MKPMANGVKLFTYVNFIVGNKLDGLFQAFPALSNVCEYGQSQPE